jgi:ABC-type lipoprotein export system ATPase subunit
MLKLRNLEKYFETKAGRLYVLRNIDLDVAQGEFLTIMGPSGAGKSSLLGILGMLDAAWVGEYHLLDQPVHRMNLKQRAELNKRTIGFVFQQYHLLDNLTVYENLEIPLSYRNIRAPSARRSSPTRSTASASWARRTSIRASSRAVSSSWWESRAPSSPARNSSSPTSRPATCIRRRVARSWSCSG